MKESAKRDGALINAVMGRFFFFSLMNKKEKQRWLQEDYVFIWMHVESFGKIGLVNLNVPRNNRKLPKSAEKNPALNPPTDTSRNFFWKIPPGLTSVRGQENSSFSQIALCFLPLFYFLLLLATIAYEYSSVPMGLLHFSVS